jgi:hypothetical protein
MKRLELSAKLMEADRKGGWAFTFASFGALFEKGSPHYVKLMMKRLADQGVLTRAVRGTYVNPLARSLPLDIRRGLIRFLRPREVSYVSRESKLSEAGAISQIAAALTCMTTGASGTFETPWGIIEFTHTNRDIDVGNDVYCGDDGTLEATVQRAARDLRRVGRNVDLIDPETLADAISDVYPFCKPPSTMSDSLLGRPEKEAGSICRAGSRKPTIKNRSSDRRETKKRHHVDFSNECQRSPLVPGHRPKIVAHPGHQLFGMAA